MNGDEGAEGAGEAAPRGEPTREELRQQRDDARREAQQQRARRRGAEERLARVGALADLPSETLGLMVEMAQSAGRDRSAAADAARRYADLLDAPATKEAAVPDEPTTPDAPDGAAAPEAPPEADAMLAAVEAANLTPGEFAQYLGVAVEAKQKAEAERYDAEIDKRATQKVAQRDRLAAHGNLATYGVPTDTKEGAAAADLIIANVRAGVPQDVAIRTVAEAQGWGEVIQALDSAAAPADGAAAAPAAEVAAAAPAPPPPPLPGPAIAPLGSLQSPAPDASRPARAASDNTGLRGRDRVAASLEGYAAARGYTPEQTKDLVRRGTSIAKPTGADTDRPAPDFFRDSGGRFVPA